MSGIPTRDARKIIAWRRDTSIAHDEYRIDGRRPARTINDTEHPDSKNATMYTERIGRQAIIQIPAVIDRGEFSEFVVASVTLSPSQLDDLIGSLVSMSRWISEPFPEPPTTEETKDA